MARSRCGNRSKQELRAKVIRVGRSYIVRLPKELRLDERQSELRVRLEGKRVILEPLDEWPEAFLEALGSCPDFPEPAERARLPEARDRVRF